jgi:hypothetical protein
MSGYDLTVDFSTVSAAGEHAEENDANATGTVTIQATDPTVLRRTLTGDVTLHVAGAPTPGYVSPNQLTYSADLRSTAEAGETRPWTDTRTSLSLSAAVGPDGRTTLQKLIEDATTNSFFRNQTVSGLSPNQTLTMSIVVRDAGDGRNICILLQDSGATGNNTRVFINPATGAVVSGPTAAGNATAGTVTVTTLANSCYRVDLTCQPNTSGTNTNVTIFLASGSGLSYAGDGSSGVYIGNVQVNTGQPVGMIENGAIRAYGYGWSTELRTTQDGTGGRDLTILPANLLTYSEQFDNAAWTQDERHDHRRTLHPLRTAGRRPTSSSKRAIPGRRTPWESSGSRSSRRPPIRSASTPSRQGARRCGCSLEIPGSRGAGHLISICLQWTVMSAGSGVTRQH